MQDNLKHKWQSAIKLTSALLDKTRRIAESCPIGTENDYSRIGSIQEQWARDRISVRSSAQDRAEILKESTEFALNKGLQEWVMRVMFRSVWETVSSVNVLAQTLVDDPCLISARNIHALQRDLIDKIIDIPYIHRSGKSRQYLDYLGYVSLPRKLHYMSINLIQLVEDKTYIVCAKTAEFLDSLYSHLDIVKSRLDVDKENVQDGAEFVAIYARISDLTNLYVDLKNLFDTLPEKEVIAIFKEKIRKVPDLLTAFFVRRYYPKWGSWLTLSPEEQDKFNSQLKSWSNLDHKKKLRKGLFQYIDDDDFYKLTPMGLTISDIKSRCKILPTMYHYLSLYVHDSIGNPIHREQEWVESTEHLERWTMLRIGVIALYVAAAHYYDCADISHEMESLQRILLTDA